MARKVDRIVTAFEWRQVVSQKIQGDFVTATEIWDRFRSTTRSVAFLVGFRLFRHECGCR